MTDQLDAQLDKIKELETHLQVKEKELEDKFLLSTFLYTATS